MKQLKKFFNRLFCDHEYEGHLGCWRVTVDLATGRKEMGEPTIVFLKCNKCGVTTWRRINDKFRERLGPTPKG